MMKNIIILLTLFIMGCEAPPIGIWTIEQRNFDKGNTLIGKDSYQSSIELTYCTVKLTKVNYIQIVRIINLKDGKVIRDEDRPYMFCRETKDGWAVDQEEGEDSPLYTETGFDAKLKDNPHWSRCNVRWEFQSAAVEVLNDNTVKILNVIKWGFNVDEKGKLKSHLIWIMPYSQDVMDSITKWNEQIKENICKNSENQIEIFTKN